MRKPRRPIARVSKRQSARKRLYAAMAHRFKLDHPLCQACPKVRPGKPQRWTDDVHHSHGKIGELLFYVPWFVAVCRECHNWIGNHPAAARKLGLLCELGQWNKQPPISGNEAGINQPK